MKIKKQKYYIIAKREMYLIDSKNNIKFGQTGRPALFATEMETLAAIAAIGGIGIMKAKEVKVSFEVKSN